MKRPNYRIGPILKKFMDENWNKENPTKEDLNRAVFIIKLLDGFISNYQFKFYKEEDAVAEAKAMEGDITHMAILKFNQGYFHSKSITETEDEA